MTIYNAVTMGSYGSEWQHKGYCGRGPVADLLDCHQGRPALVVGSGEGVFEQVREASARLSDPVVLAANDVGMYLPKLDHWVSLHADNLGTWKTVRWLHAREKEQTVYHGVDARPFIDVNWEGLTPLFCLSGYFAMQLAWLMGCAPIVLCGCPGDTTRRFFDLDARQDFGYGGAVSGSDHGVREQIEQEMRRLPELKATVRSMSGWTKTFFGEV